MTGGWLSGLFSCTTVTVNEPVLTLPAESVAWALTTVVPKGKLEPDVGVVDRQLRRGPEHDRQVSRDLLRPGARQDRHQGAGPGRDLGQESVVERPVGQLIEERLSDLERRIAELRHTRRRLQELARRTRELDPAECHGYCHIIEE